MVGQADVELIEEKVAVGIKGSGLKDEFSGFQRCSRFEDWQVEKAHLDGIVTFFGAKNKSDFPKRRS